MFKSLKVIDLSTVLAGPSVGTFFAELGAEVIKIEHPIHGDVTRTWKLPTEEKAAQTSAYFASVNYGKSYTNLDLTDLNDQKKLAKLLVDADVLLSNFKKGDAEKFDLTASSLNEKYPKLIHGKISGFGSESDRVAYDLILQAETGFMSMNGTPESGPVKMPVALIDVLAAHQLKEGLLVSLINRMQTGMGGEVVVSLFDAAVCSLANQASNYLMEGHVPKRIGSLHPNIAPYGELFTTKDKVCITFAIGSNTHFIKLCELLDHPDWAEDQRFVTNVNRVAHREILSERIDMQIKRMNFETIDLFCRKNFVPMGVVKTVKEVLEEKGVRHLIRTEKIDQSETKRVSQIAFQLKG